ncbi:TPA: insecticidal delta-endotoxin Cry8Ea1 family protein, partial [Bacillus cereus]
MATINELYPVPYNVLARPVSQNNDALSDFMDIFNDLKGAYDEFSKTGAKDPLQNHLMLAWNAYQTGKIDYLALTKATISLAGLIPGVGAAVPIVNMVVDMVWPSLFGAPKADPYAELFKQIMKAVEDYVGQQFNNFEISWLQTSLQSLRDALAKFQNSIQVAVCQGRAPESGFLATSDADCPSTPIPCEPCSTHLTDVKTAFGDANTTFTTYLPHFKNPASNQTTDDNGFYGDLIAVTLPMFTTAATLQMVMYKGYIQFMEKWGGLTSGELNDVKAELQELIRDNTKVVRDTFKKYLPTLDTGRKQSINKYNRYVRNMVLNVFDLAAIWPSFDGTYYSSSLQLDQTRLVFSDIAGPWEGNENIAANVIDIFSPVSTWVGYQEGSDLRNFTYPRMDLQNVQFHQQYVDSHSVKHCYSDGLKLTYNDNQVITAGQNNTDESNQSNKHGYGALVQSPVTDINVYSQNTMYLDVSSIRVNGGWAVAGCSPLSSQGNSNNEALTGQKINVIYPVQSNDKSEKHADTSTKWGYMSTHIPFDLVPENIIGDIDQNTKLPSTQIKGFPFEKYGTEYNNRGIVLVPEWINGNHSVKLSSGQSVGIHITNQTKQKYEVRCRYASNGTNNVYFNVDLSENPFRNTVSFDSTANRQMAVQGENGKYVVKSITTVEIPAGNQGFYVHITNQGSSDLFLDRIEFAPYVPYSVPIDYSQMYHYTDGGNNTYTLWSSSSTVATNMNLTGLIYNWGTGTIQLYKDNSLVEKFDMSGPGTHCYSGGNGPINVGTHGGTHCDDTSSSLSITVTDKEFNKIVLELKAPPQSSGGHNYYGEGVQISNIGLDFKNETKNSYFYQPIDLQNITTQVNALFTPGTQDALATDVSDYEIEEVVLKVDALSDEVFGKEKKALRKLVNQAKRLSKARNLLVGGNFDNLDAWYRGRNVVNVSDHELFKSDHVLLPPPTLHQTYIFQKVEESKLKANTRYTVSGFIAHAEDLEIVVSRYGQEVKKVVQVPYGEAFPLTSSGPVCCVPRSTRNGKIADPHFFSYSINVGALDMAVGPGIEFGLRIVERTGMARVSNLEIREDRPLTTNELRNVQRAARNWRTAYDQERAEVTALIQPVLNQINALYENEDWNGAIRSGVSYHDLEAIVLPTLPKLNHWFMSDMLGEQGSILAQFQEALDRAYTQLEESTLLHNGHFTTDAANWTIEGDAHHAILEDGRRVLRLPDWSSSVSQTIEIENFNPDKEYQLVFHAQGEGTVSLQHGEEGEYMETHLHKFANFTTSHRQGV